MLDWWVYMDSTPLRHWIRERGVRTFALAWIYGPNAPGFHVVLEDGDEYAIVPGRHPEVFLLIPLSDEMVCLA